MRTQPQDEYLRGVVNDGKVRQRHVRAGLQVQWKPAPRTYLPLPPFRELGVEMIECAEGVLHWILGFLRQPSRALEIVLPGGPVRQFAFQRVAEARLRVSRQVEGIASAGRKRGAKHRDAREILLVGNLRVREFHERQLHTP